MKFRYILKNKHTGNIHKKVYTLNQIQEKGLSGLFDIENYDILAVDRFILNANSVDYFENDIWEFEGKIAKSGRQSTVTLQRVIREETFIFDCFSLKNIIEMQGARRVGNIYENSDLLI